MQRRPAPFTRSPPVAAAGLALVAALLLAGCLGSLETTSLEKDRPLQLGANETWNRTLALEGDNEFTLRYEVAPVEAEGAVLVVCPPQGGPTGGNPSDFSRDPSELRMFTDCTVVDGGRAYGASGSRELNPQGEPPVFRVHCHRSSEAACATAVTLTLEEVIPGPSWDRGTLFMALVGVILGLRVLADPLDRGRIREAVEKRGGRVIEMSWRPFPRGWFFEKGERFYEVTYETADGIAESTLFKTSLFTGVWSGEDRDQR